MPTHETTGAAEAPTFAELREMLALVSRQMQEETDQRQKETVRRQKEADRQMQETRRLIRETNQKTARLMEESNQKTDRLIRETNQETDRLIQENSQETERLIRETIQETARLMEESSQKTDRQLRETNRQLKKTESHFTSQWGKLMESLVEGDLVLLLNDRGIAVKDTFLRRRARRNGKHREFDIIAENGHDVVVVEVKTTLRSEDVTRFLSQLSTFTEFLPHYRGKRILGAVAYLEKHDDVATYAESKGLFVIRATGSAASIRNAENFQPKSFA